MTVQGLVSADREIEDSLAQSERLAWTQYAQQRFVLGGQRERKARQDFERQIAQKFSAMRDAARRSHGQLDFRVARLRLHVLVALESACLYCGDLLGLENFGITYAEPPRNSQSGSFGRANVVVPCAACAAAKGSLNSTEWLDIIAALRAADPVAARETLATLAEGRQARSARRRGSSPGPPARK